MSIRRGRRRPSTGNGWQRFRRWAGLDGNPLRRGSDRLQAWMRLAAVVLTLAGLVMTGFAARASYATEVATQRADAVAGYRTTGHVLSVTDPNVTPDGAILRGMIRVAWHDRTGQRHVDLLVAPKDGHKTTGAIPLWVDARGKPSASAPQPGQPVTAAAMTGVLGAGLTVTATMLLYLLALVPLERHRLAEWQSEWSVVEPGWRRQVL